MDWNTIILALLSTTTLGGIFGTIIYRKQNKQLKENEVKKDDANTQTEQINLGELFMQKSADMFQRMQELQEQTYQVTLKNDTTNESIIKNINDIISEQKRQACELKRQSDELRRMADEQSHIVKFVNGEYQDFLRRNGFKKKS